MSRLIKKRDSQNSFFSGKSQEESVKETCTTGSRCISSDEIQEQAGVSPSSTTWWKVGIALAVAGQTMIFSLAIDLSPMEELEYRWWLHGGMLITAFIVILLLGKPLLQESFRMLLQRRITVDQLFTLGVFGAFAGSLMNSIRGVDEVYYELVSLLLVLYTVGKAIGARSRALVWNEWKQIEEQMDKVQRRRGKDLEEVSLDEIQPGDLVVLGAGGLIPADGEIIEGNSYVKETFYDGSLEPRARQPGDTVHAGGVVLDGSLVIRVKKVGEETEWAQIRRALLHGRSEPSHWQQQADHIMQWFIPLVCLVTILTFLGWWWFHTWDEGLVNAMTVLLIACPCAMGLATPLALWNGMAQLARYGIIVQSGDFLHGMMNVKAIVWDKTGTLGSPEWELHSFKLIDEERRNEEMWREAIYLIEGVSKHPLALTLQRLFKTSVTGKGKVLSSRYIAGQGVEGEVQWEEGAIWHIALFEKSGSVTEKAKEDFFQVPGGGQKELSVYKEGKEVGVLTLQEVWVDEAIPALRELRDRGIPQYLFTGDQRGIQTENEAFFTTQKTRLTPSEKITEIAALQKEKGAVLYLGDGLNDLGAMQEAQISIAVGEALPIVQSGSKALLRNHRLRLVSRMLDFAVQTGESLQKNLRFSIVYNLIAVSLAAAGLLTPLIAALFMVISSVIVSTRALRLSFEVND